MTLKKVYSENWSTVRGTEKKLTGHSTDYYINEEKVKKKDYEERISEVMDEELFKMLTVPNYFAEQLHWSDRREMLIEMAGEINDEQIIASDPQLEGYHELLDGRQVESVKNILSDKRKKALERVDEVPGLIRENQDKISEVPEVDIGEKLSTLKKEKSDLEERLAKARSGGGVSHLQVKVDDIKNDKRKIVNEHAEKNDEKISDARAVLRKKMDAYDSLKKELSSNDWLERAKQKYREATEMVDSMKAKIEEVEESEPEPKASGSDLDECPMCGQDMPDDGDSDDHYEEYVKEFNEEKAEKLKALSGELEIAQDEAEKSKKELENAVDKDIEMQQNLSALEDAVEEAEADLDRLKTTVGDPKESDQYKELSKKQEALEDKISEIRKNNSKQISEIQSEIEEAESKIKEVHKVEYTIEQNQKIKGRIEELKKEQKDLSTVAGKCDDGLSLIQRFEVAKADLVTDRVNDMFDIVEWKMHEPLISGGINDQMCEAIVDGVPYKGGLNNARRVQAGLDIINTIGEHFDKTAPVVIDNAESVTELNTYNLQVIALYVSEEHEQLTIKEIK